VSIWHLPDSVKLFILEFYHADCGQGWGSTYWREIFCRKKTLSELYNNLITKFQIIVHHLVHHLDHLTVRLATSLRSEIIPDVKLSFWTTRGQGVFDKNIWTVPVRIVLLVGQGVFEGLSKLNFGQILTVSKQK
jgi:hypothetical protein